MVKLRSPMLSTAASGTLAGRLTFGKLRGTSYARNKPTPKQPNSLLQLATRAMFQFLTANWHNLTAAQQATWSDAFPSTDISNYNAFIKYNLERWRSFHGPTKAYPETLDGTPPTIGGAGAVGGVRHIDHAVMPAINPGDNWGFLILRRLDTQPPAQLQYCKHLILAEEAKLHHWTETPLPAGTHKMLDIPFLSEGSIRLDKASAPTATVT